MMRIGRYGFWMRSGRRGKVDKEVEVEVEECGSCL